MAILSRVFTAALIVIAFGSAGLHGANAQGLGKEEIIVTSQKREQRVQDVPIAVSAYSQAVLERTGVDDIQEIQNLAPSFQASTNSSESQGLVIRIRGIGTQGNNPAFESAVGVFIDGVYRSRAGAALSELLDIERIEVLRGPQGTLFGRNTSAGALSIVTAGPEFEYGGYIEGTYGRFDEIDLRGSVYGPIVKDKLAFRLSGLYKERDGVIDIVEDFAAQNAGMDTEPTKIGEVNDKDRFFLKGQLLFTPTDDIELRVIADYREQRESCCYATTLVSGTAALVYNAIEPGSQLLDPMPFNREATINSPLTQNVDDWGISAELTIDFDWGTVTSITAYRDFESFRQLDIDFTSADLVDQDRGDGIELFTQELRVQGTWGDLDWLVGMFYADEKITLDSTLVHGSQYEAFINGRLGPLVAAFFGPGLGVTNYTELAALFGVAPGTGWADGTGSIGDRFESNNSSFSIFTHNVYNITDRLEFIIGARFIADDKRGQSELNTVAPGCTAIRPALKSLPNFTFDDVGIIPGDLRRVKDVLAALGCLGITSPAFEFDLEKDDDEWAGVVGFNYRFSDQVNGYITASRGYKAGGINLDRAGTILTLTGDNTDPNNFLDPRFDAEVTKSIEVGVKTEFADQRIQVNLAAFYMDLNNFQLNTFTGFNFVPENVDDVNSKGFEMDFTALVTDRFQLRGGLAYTKADYGKMITDETNILTNERSFRAGTTPLPEISSLAGRQLTNAPRWVITGGATYFQPIANDFEMMFHADFRWSDEINTGSDLDPEKLQEDFIVVNGKITFGPVDQSWKIEVWGRNIFGEKYQQVAFDLPLQSNDGYATFLADPSTYGVTVRANF